MPIQEPFRSNSGFVYNRKNIASVDTTQTSPRVVSSIVMKHHPRAFSRHRLPRSKQAILSTLSSLGAGVLLIILFIHHESLPQPSHILSAYSKPSFSRWSESVKHDLFASDSNHFNSSANPPSSVPIRSEILDIPHVHGGIIFKVPAAWNRLHTSWFKTPPVLLKTPQQSRYRYIYPTTRMMTSDGIGHSMGVINYVLNIALRLNLTYIHRRGLYSSLTAKDQNAVENFFGWGDNEVIRTYVQEQGCNPRNGSWPPKDDLYSCHICASPKRNGSMKIEHVVFLTKGMGPDCRYSPKCQQQTTAFLKKYPHSHTIFQTPEFTCSPPATESNFLLTKNFFSQKYWKRHGHMLWPYPVASVKDLRPISLDPAVLNVAIHIRRGDFLNPDTYPKREITDDTIFAKVLRNALSMILEGGGAFSRIPVVVHIYSEGKLIKDSVPSTHAVDMQDKRYYDSSGKHRTVDWWKRLILQTSEHPELSPWPDLEKSLRVVHHISEDTLHSIHDMVSADLFIGSYSGLSVNMVWAIARGIVLIPHSPSIDNERGKKGHMCCSIPFENDSGAFSHILFRRYWDTYAEANDDSATLSAGLPPE